MSDLQRMKSAAEEDPRLSEELSMFTPAELVVWADSKGYRLTMDEAESFCETHQELSDEDLEQVAGGWTGNEPGGP